MKIKKFFEYNSEILYKEINSREFDNIESDNIEMLNKISNILCEKYNLYILSRDLDGRYNKGVIKLSHRNAFILAITLKYYDDFTYIKLEADFLKNPMIYKCDQLVGFKLFIKKEFQEYFSSLNFNFDEELPKKKGFFDFLKRKNK